MCKIRLVLATMFISLFVSAAAHGAPAPATTPTAPVVSAIEKALLSRTAKAEADIEILFAKAKANPSATNLTAYADCRKVDIADRDKIDKSLRARIDQLKKADKADKKVVAELVRDVAELKGMQQKDRDALVSFVGRLAEVEVKVTAVEQRTTSLETRATGIETRQNATDAKVVEIAGKVAEVTSKLWTSEFAFGLFTEKGFAMAGSGFNARHGLRNASGNGWFTSLSLGAGDLVSKPSTTSAIVRTGGQFSMGGPRSALTIDVGALAGAAGTSLTNDPGFVVGGTAGLTLRPRAWYGIGINAGMDLVTGHYSGLNAFVGLSFSPLGELQIGE